MCTSIRQQADKVSKVDQASSSIIDFISHINKPTKSASLFRVAKHNTSIHQQASLSMEQSDDGGRRWRHWAGEAQGGGWSQAGMQAIRQTHKQRQRDKFIQSATSGMYVFFQLKNNNFCKIMYKHNKTLMVLSL